MLNQESLYTMTRTARQSRVSLSVNPHLLTYGRPTRHLNARSPPRTFCQSPKADTHSIRGQVAASVALVVLLSNVKVHNNDSAFTQPRRGRLISLAFCQASKKVEPNGS
ncbi:hypothetical protein BDZ94DRAFT_1251111 [Collybia nuda]|uniref:Uncharacterized protein n=1 Tax=Collybia nuda TaxID=64659 RepID=A0A9P5YCV2_9AGAR|nr:hypothetical protein BDZ94DRAFT_1251111 [Collybia nuda]